jgi:heme A synthase
VRAHGAGLACPDWPLCFGEWIPRLDFHVAFEFGHRVLAGGVAVAFVALAAGTLRVGAAREAVAAWLAAGGALLAVQILLGAFTVWLGLAPWTVVAHLVTGNAFAATLLLVAIRLRRATRPGQPPARVTPGARALVSLAAAAVAAQVVLGGLVSSTYAGLACPGWPTCDGEAWFPGLGGALGIHLAHRTWAYFVLAILGATALAVRRPPLLARLLAVAWLVACAQAGVGIAAVLLRLPVELAGLHSALAALLVLVVSCAVHEVWTARAQPAGLERDVGRADPHVAPRSA